MSEREPAPPVDATREAGPGRSRVTLLAAALVVLLALGAGLWPRGGDRDSVHTILVFDSSGSRSRETELYASLQDVLDGSGAGALDLVTTATLTAFRDRLAERPDFVFAPDGLAVTLPATSYVPLVVGRRAAPWNLRPRSVLVFRRSAGDAVRPWQTRPAATVFGDSVSLVATGVVRDLHWRRWPSNLACGPDPFDHGPVLHALRLGAFDYAVVRQWDAERFFAAGLLDRGQYAMRELTPPLPDAVLFVSRGVARHTRLLCGEALGSLGRQQAGPGPGGEALRGGLARIHLIGFNLLLEPDWDLVRRNYGTDWLPGSD